MIRDPLASRLAALAALCASGLALSTAAAEGPASQDISFDAITYGEALGCGLFVEYFVDGQLAEDEQGRTGGFILGSPPGLTLEECLDRCAEGHTSVFIAITRLSYPADEATGWCFQGQDVVGGAYDDLPYENTNGVCSDGIDNDGDGWIDCLDDECRASEDVTVCPEPVACLLSLAALSTLAVLVRQR